MNTNCRRIVERRASAIGDASDRPLGPVRLVQRPVQEILTPVNRLPGTRREPLGHLAGLPRFVGDDLRNQLAQQRALLAELHRKII